MKVKIPPYPNFIITNETLKKSDVPTVKKSDSEGLSNQLIMIIPFNENESRVLRARSIKHNGNTFISALPNPVHLFITLGIENYNLSEDIKFQKFPKCGNQIGEDIYLLPIEENGTHQCYNDYIKYRSSSVIMLISAVEAFINHIIPNDFIYKTEKKELSKTEIEGPKVFFIDKLEKVIPQFLGNENFWDSYKEIKMEIVKLYNIRKNLIHLKTNGEDDFTAYFKVIDEMLELDINHSISNVIEFMNNIKPKFIELEDS
jgi:hypothetical protein